MDQDGGLSIHPSIKAPVFVNNGNTMNRDVSLYLYYILNQGHLYKNIEHYRNGKHSTLEKILESARGLLSELI